MSLADTYLAQFKALQSEVASKFAKLQSALSSLDKQVSALYHEIERLDFEGQDGISASYAAVTMLQTVLRQRRVIKGEIAQLGPLNSAIQSSCDKAADQCRKKAEKNNQIRQSLNVTLTINDIGGITL